MRKIIFIIIIFAFNTKVSAQIFDFGIFPNENSDKKTIITSDLLKRLSWGKIKQLSKENEDYTSERKDSLLTKYYYSKRGEQTSFEITSYNGKVLEYQSRIFNEFNESESNYFDKNLWLEYSHNYLPNLADSLKLTSEQPKSVLKAYYTLLGVGIYDEYGWICEYSTIGKPTERRKAVLALLTRPDFFWDLIDYPNIYTQLYAVDAIIYWDYKDKKQLQETKDKKNKNKSDREFIRYLKSKLLTESDWEKIYAIRDSNQKVNICMNGRGSYKIFESTTSELLSDEAIREIPKQYEYLKKLGYIY